MSFKALKDLLESPILSENLLEVNHTIPKFVQKLLGITDKTVQNSVPGEILRLVEHQYAPGSFHSFLGEPGSFLLYPPNTPAVTTSEVLAALKDAYSPEKFNRPNVLKVALRWLKDLPATAFEDATKRSEVQAWLTAEGI